MSRRRRAAPSRLDRKIFRNTGAHTKAINVGFSSRGGIRL